MKKNKITLEDGRYLIYYSFDNGKEAGKAEDAAGASDESGAAADTSQAPGKTGGKS